MLKYIGGGFLPGVPARDLSDDEVEEYGGEVALLASGLYVKPAEGQQKQKPQPQRSEKGNE